MRSSSYYQSTKSFRCRAIGTLLLALPIGSALQLPLAQAQPAVTPPAKKSPFPLAPEQKAAINKVLAISRQDSVCKTLVNLKVENATLEDVVTRLRQLLPTGSLSVELRDAGLVRVTFDLKEARVGDVIGHVAALAGSKLFIEPDELLICTEAQLSQGELEDIRQRQTGEWIQSAEGGGAGWSNKANQSKQFTRAIAQEATGHNADQLPAAVIKTTFGNFSPDSQKILEEMANWFSAGTQNAASNLPPLHLDASSPITVDTTNPNAITVSFNPGISSPAAPTMAVRSAVASVARNN